MMSTGAPVEAEREIKFTLSSGRAHVARNWLDRFCRRDPAFPAAIVWTLYFDTTALVSLGEKINSEYLKRKVRVRWYSDLEGRLFAPAFVEAKLRVGTYRSKVRERLPYPASEIAGWELDDPRWRTVLHLLRRHGATGLESWQPMLLLRYRRDRFIEPHSRARISLDTDIAVAAVCRRLASAADRSVLGTAVLEVKGQSERLPPPLQPLLALGVHKGSFSKFLAVYARATRQSM